VKYKKPRNSKNASAVIPKTIKINGNVYKVTEISANAFKNCKRLKKVTIGKNITKIGKNSFLELQKFKTYEYTIIKADEQKCWQKCIQRNKPKSG